MEAGTATTHAQYSSKHSSAPPASGRWAARAARFDEPTYAAFRWVAGALFACHGLQKVFGALGAQAAPVGSQFWLGGLIELATGALMAVGLFTRPAAFLASGTMAVAYLQFHWKLAFANAAWLPIINQGELAVLYCFAFLFMAAHGDGIASLGSRKKEAPTERT
jgi:putative oxidoreductase